MKAIGLAIAALCASAISMGAHAVDCTGLPEWNSATAYNGNTKVQETGKAYTAAWWSQGHSPASYSGQWQEWKLDGPCEGVNHAPVAKFTASPNPVQGGQTVNVDASASSDPDGDALTYSWNNSAFTSSPTYGIVIGYNDACFPRLNSIELIVKDSKGATTSTSQSVTINPTPGNPACKSSSSTPSSIPVVSSSSRTTSSSSSFRWVESSASSIANGCTSPQFVVGTTYNAGQLVQNGGNEYVCNIAGWCSSTAAWAYAPGTGSYWDQAWSLVRSCGVTTSSTPSSVSSVSSVSSKSSSSVSSVPVTGLPKHALVGYWHNFNNGSGLIRLADVDNTWDVIVIAFADDAGNGNVAFNLDSGLNKAQFISDVAAKRAAGKKVVLSFGGQNGTVTLNNATNTTNFVNSTKAIMNEYGFDGIDIDLESGANVSWGAPVISNLVVAIKSLKQSFPNLYVSMAPEHPYVQGGLVASSGIWGAYLPLIDGVRNELTILHVQLYNNGGLSTPYSPQPLAAGSVDFMVGSIKMLIEGFTLANNTQFVGLRPDQVAIGVPSGSRSASSGFVNITDLNNAVNCLTKLQNCGSIKPNQAYPTFRGVMTWSINWDVADGRPFSVPVKANLNSLP